MVEYLSPTSLAIWEDDAERFYLQYVCKLPRQPQTKPMAVGSAFDAFVKSYLHERLIGKDPSFEADTLFEAQVEVQNRDFARVAGQDCLAQYRSSGALGDLCLELGEAVGKPMFEGTLCSRLDDAEVTILGKPDLFFVNSQGLRVVVDWKVNGYCSQGLTSPTKGYVRRRPGGATHRDASVSDYYGMQINVGMCLEEVNMQWADQLTTYAWLAGEPIGSERWIAGIDQLACRCGAAVEITVAEHRCRVSRAWQLRLAERYASAWAAINSDWKFRNMTREQSQEREEMLLKQMGSEFSNFLFG